MYQLAEQCKQAERDLTVGQNLDRQIASAVAELKRLESIKREMSEAGLLNVRIDSIRRAMGY